MTYGKRRSVARVFACCDLQLDEIDTQLLLAPDGLQPPVKRTLACAMHEIVTKCKIIAPYGGHDDVNDA